MADLDRVPCGECAWFERHKGPGEALSEKGVCRVRSVAGDGWPVRFADDWCGEAEDAAEIVRGAVLQLSDLERFAEAAAALAEDLPSVVADVALDTSTLRERGRWVLDGGSGALVLYDRPSEGDAPPDVAVALVTGLGAVELVGLY